MRILVFRSGDEPARLLEGVNFSQTSHASTTESESSRTMTADFAGWGGDQEFLRIVKLNCSKQWLNIWASFQQTIIRPLLTLLRGLWYPQTDRIIYRLKAAWENKSSYFLFQANKLKQRKKKNKMQTAWYWFRAEWGSNEIEAANVFPIHCVCANNRPFITGQAKKGTYTIF